MILEEVEMGNTYLCYLPYSNNKTTYITTFLSSSLNTNDYWQTDDYRIIDWYSSDVGYNQLGKEQIVEESELDTFEYKLLSKFTDISSYKKEHPELFI